MQRVLCKTLKISNKKINIKMKFRLYLFSLLYMSVSGLRLPPFSKCKNTFYQKIHEITHTLKCTGTHKKNVQIVMITYVKKITLTHCVSGK